MCTSRPSKRSKFIVSYLASYIILITNIDILQSTKKDEIIQVKNQVWPLLIMDEVHGLPADSTTEVISKLKCNMKIGLTATPYRQDNKITEIFYKIGPKLHESTIVDLKQDGYVSKVYCVQILVGMYEDYHHEYKKYENAEGRYKAQTNTFYQLNVCGAPICVAQEVRGSAVFDRPAPGTQGQDPDLSREDQHPVRHGHVGQVRRAEQVPDPHAICGPLGEKEDF